MARNASVQRGRAFVPSVADRLALRPAVRLGSALADVQLRMAQHGVDGGEIPGALFNHGPGYGVAMPLLMVIPSYVAVLIWIAVLGCKLIDWAKTRRPHWTPIQLIGFCWVTMCAAVFVLEGLFFVRLGVWSFPGAHLTIFPSHYYRYPLYEIPIGGAYFTVLICIRYFVNDRGELWPERGASRLAVGAGRQAIVRGLALVAAVQLGFFLFYHLPSGLIALNESAWPNDVQNRSYFTNGMCGPVVDRACPGPNTPIAGPGRPYLNMQGKLVVPKR